MTKREFYLAVLSRIDAMLSFAETKITFMLAYLGVLLAILANQAGEIKYLLQRTSQELVTVTLVLLLLSLLVLFLTLLYIGRVLLPQLQFSRRASMIYFADISKLSENRYLAEMRKMKDNEIEDEILSQIHAVSAVISQKFQNIKLATYSLGLFTVLWLVIIIEIIIFAA